MDPIAAMRRVYSPTCDAANCKRPALTFTGLCVGHTRQLEAFAREVDETLSGPAADRPAPSR